MRDSPEGTVFIQWHFWHLGRHWTICSYEETRARGRRIPGDRTRLPHIGGHESDCSEPELWRDCSRRSIPADRLITRERHSQQIRDLPVLVRKLKRKCYSWWTIVDWDTIIGQLYSPKRIFAAVARSYFNRSTMAGDLSSRSHNLPERVCYRHHF